MNAPCKGRREDAIKAGPARLACPSGAHAAAVEINPDGAMPHSDLVGRVHFESLVTPGPNNILGVKGAGEAGTTGALPTAMNAIIDALRPAGISHLDMPASAPRAWRALHDAQTTGDE